MWGNGWEPTEFDYLHASLWGWMGEEALTWIGGGHVCRLLPSGGRDDTQRGGTWDLIYAPWVQWGAVRGMGSHTSDQSGRVWSSADGQGTEHLACINGQTTEGKRLQYMHTFMSGYKCTRQRAFSFLFRPGHLNEEKQCSPPNIVTLTQNKPAQVPRCENVAVASEWVSSIDTKAVQPASLLLFALQRRTTCYLWVCRGHEMD